MPAGSTAQYHSPRWVNTLHHGKDTQVPACKAIYVIVPRMQKSHPHSRQQEMQHFVPYRKEITNNLYFCNKKTVPLPNNA